MPLISAARFLHAPAHRANRSAKPFNLLRIPLAYAFAFPLGMGAAGVWWAINVSSWLKTSAKLVALFRGKWLELEI